MLDYIKYFTELLKDSDIRTGIIKMIRELKAILWFLSFILFLFVSGWSIAIVVSAIAPNGLL